MSFNIECGFWGDCGDGCRDPKYDACYKECCSAQKKHCKNDEKCMIDRNCQGILHSNQ